MEVLAPHFCAPSCGRIFKLVYLITVFQYTRLGAKSLSFVFRNVILKFLFVVSCWPSDSGSVSAYSLPTIYQISLSLLQLGMPTGRWPQGLGVCGWSALITEGDSGPIEQMQVAHVSWWRLWHSKICIPWSLWESYLFLSQPLLIL